MSARTQVGRALLGGAVLAVALVAMPASRASAWTCISGSCPKWCTTATYGLTIASSDLGDATSETEVQRGMDEWQYPMCSGLVTAYTGRSSATAGRSGDGQAVVGWVESSWRHGSGAIGVTGPVWNGRNCIQEADMVLNGQNYTWITGPGSGGRVNTFSIVLHEGGHYFGLGHSADRGATMYFAYTGGIDAINSDDQAGICTLYPGDGMPPPDCSTTGCPGGQECVGGRCIPIMGDGTVCSPCMSNGDCGSGAADLCLRYPDGVLYCGKSCSSSADCGSDVCADLGGVRQCVRLSGGSPDCSTGPMGGCSTDSDCAATERCNGGRCEPRPMDRGMLGEPCMDSDACNSGVCFAGVCTQSCDPLEPATSCPAGFFCDGTATGSCGDGLCFAGGAGSGALGASCSEHTECASLLCDGGVCASPCIPGGTTMCPSGFVCQVGTTPGCGSCKMVGRTGDRCEDEDDCASRMCAILGDRHFCTSICETGEDCPSGYSCESAGSTSVCVPPEGGPPPGSVGAPCRVNEECDSRLCAVTADRTFCTETCGSDEDCPAMFGCQPAGTSMVCVPLAEGGGGGCGCSVPGGSPGRALWPLAFLAAVLPVVLAWRRRRSPP